MYRERKKIGFPKGYYTWIWEQQDWEVDQQTDGKMRWGRMEEWLVEKGGGKNYITDKNGRSSWERQEIVAFCTCQWTEWMSGDELVLIATPFISWSPEISSLEFLPVSRKFICKFSETLQEIICCVSVLISHSHWLNNTKSFPINLLTSGVLRGGGWCVQTPPPEILKALQNRAKLNLIVKTVKNCWI